MEARFDYLKHFRGSFGGEFGSDEGGNFANKSGGGKRDGGCIRNDIGPFVVIAGDVVEVNASIAMDVRRDTLEEGAVKGDEEVFFGESGGEEVINDHFGVTIKVE